MKIEFVKELPQNDPFTKQFVKNVKRATGNSGALSVSKPYDLMVFIGRFQPYHLGHKKVIDRALELSDNVLVLIGSAGKARSTRNPFTFEERSQMIQETHPNVETRPISDAAYNDTMWVTEVQKIVNKEALHILNGDGFGAHGTADAHIALVGMEKDHTSYYLKLFPQWKSESVDAMIPMCATNVRKMFFEDELDGPWIWESIVPHATSVFLNKFMETDEYKRLVQEHEFIQSYKSTWGPGPFLTADSLVQVSGNVLLIKRGREYGHGLYALPGGFLGPEENFLNGAIRELREETRLKVPVAVLKGSVVASEIFDDPHRSERGRIVTQCFHFRLENEMTLPEVRGSDDADWAGFVDFSTLSEEDFFEDHYHIIRKMLKV